MRESMTECGRVKVGTGYYRDRTEDEDDNGS